MWKGSVTMNCNFIFDGNKTNECLAHGRIFHLERQEFWGNYRVDLEDNTGFSYSTNTGNGNFRAVVDTTKSIEEQMNQWANYILNQYAICDICGNLELVLPLASYDLEEFPQLEGKKVCQNCRHKFYDELIQESAKEAEQAAEQLKIAMKKEGAKYQYVFWVHPNRGDDFAVDMFISKKLTKAEINKEKKNLITEYNARLVEEPTYCIL